MRWNTKLGMSIYVYLQSRPSGNERRASPPLPRFILNFKYALSDYNLSGPHGVKICVANSLVVMFAATNRRIMCERAL